MVEVLNEGRIVALEVMHGPAHPGVALAEPEIIRGVRLGGLASGPVPPPAILQVDNVKRMTTHNITAVLQPNIIRATERFLEDLRAHDRRADRKHHPAIQASDRSGKKLEIPLSRPADGRSTKHWMIGDDVVANAGMDRHRN